MKNTKYVSMLIATLVVASFAIVAPVFAQGNKAQGQGIVRGMMGGRGVVGTVSAVNGTTLTITSKSRVKPGSTAVETTTIYTVNASGATVTKNGTASSVSAIAVGDTVMVQGTVSGTTVTAKTIRDGVTPPIIQGNGQPVVAGKVTTISGNTITITNNSNVTYTIDATNAKFVVNGTANPTISNVAVGDNLTVQGTVNGNAVVASSVIDQKAKASGTSANPGAENNGGGFGGMMSGIGNFFKHLFGF
jgi:hypothetical protein